MTSKDIYTHEQVSRYKSPRSNKELLLLLVWNYSWLFCCAWTPKPLNRWRIFWLKLFGCKIYGRPFIHPRARVEVPWNLTLHDRSTLGDGAIAYSLGTIILKERCTVAQESYLCTGTHKFDDPLLPLQTSPIIVEKEAFLGARSFILPGATIGEGAIVAACAVVTRDVPAWSVVAGNPAKKIGERQRFQQNDLS